MDRLYRSNADDAERIGAMTLSDDVSDDCRTDDGTECDGEYLETRDGDSDSAKDVTSDEQALLTVVCRKGQDEVGYGKRLYTNSTQMAKLPRVIS